MARILGEDRHAHAQCFREVCDAVTALTDLPVVFNAHEFPEDVREGDVVYHLDNGPLLREPAATRAAAIWDFSAGNVAAYPPHLRDKVTHVPLGWHASMERFDHSGPPAATCDVVWMGTVSPRRREILDGLTARGMKVEIVPHTLYGEGRDALVRRAQMTLNMLNYPESVFPVTRALYAACNAIPCVNEDAREAPPWAMLRVHRDSLVDVVEIVLEAHALIGLRTRAREKIREFPLVLPESAVASSSPESAVGGRRSTVASPSPDLSRLLEEPAVRRLAARVRQVGTDDLAYFDYGYEKEGGYALQQEPGEIATAVHLVDKWLGGDESTADCAYVEIGCGSGGLARLFNEEIAFTCTVLVDSGGHRRAREIDDNVKMMRVDGATVSYLKSDSHEVKTWDCLHALLSPVGVSHLVVLVDADHSYEGALGDLERVVDLGRDLGISTLVLAHDTHACPGVARAWSEVIEKGLLRRHAELAAARKPLGIGMGIVR